MEVVIRKMDAGDYDAFDRLLGQVHSLHVSNRPDMYREAEHPCPRGDFEAMVSDEKAIALIAESGGEALGISVVVLREPPDNPVMISCPFAYMEELCVAAGRRKQGIGRKLFECSEREAKARGVQRLDLMVWSFNKDAIAFYEEMGMTPQRCFMEKHL